MISIDKTSTPPIPSLTQQPVSASSIRLSIWLADTSFVIPRISSAESTITCDNLCCSWGSSRFLSSLHLLLGCICLVSPCLQADLCCDFACEVPVRPQIVLLLIWRVRRLKKTFFFWKEKLPVFGALLLTPCTYWWRMVQELPLHPIPILSIYILTSFERRTNPVLFRNQASEFLSFIAPFTCRLVLSYLFMFQLSSVEFWHIFAIRMCYCFLNSFRIFDISRFHHARNWRYCTDLVDCMVLSCYSGTF